ncbi:MAG: nuclease domain-containing protein [Myxococcota bacterium]
MPFRNASWSDERRRVVLWYEPSFAAGSGELRKLFPGRPWRPDLVVDVAWADGTRDLHVLDAKYRLEAGGPPREALRELWWRYGEGIGDARGRPVVRSLWVVAPGDGLWLVAPGMMREDWPLERLRGGCVSIGPGSLGALTGPLEVAIRR